MGGEITVRPANEASWDDLAAIFGERGAGAVCWCQRYKLAPGEAYRWDGWYYQWMFVAPFCMLASLRLFAAARWAHRLCFRRGGP